MKIDNFYQDILKVVNTSNLPIDAVYFVLKEVLNEVSEKYRIIKYQEDTKKEDEKIKED